MKIPLQSLYLEHEPQVRWLLRARGIPESAIDDLVHDTFVVAVRRWETRDAAVPPGHWLTGLARNVAFSYRRSEARRHLRARTAPEQPAPRQPDDLLAEREALRALRSFTATLSPKLRETFLLTDLAGVGVRQVARDLGLPAATVQSRRRLARVRFERYFSDRDVDPTRVRKQASRAGATDEAERRRQLALVVASAGSGSSLALPGSAAWAWLAAGVVASTVGVAAIRTKTAPTPRAATVTIAPDVPAPDPQSGPAQPRPPSPPPRTSAIPPAKAPEPTRHAARSIPVDPLAADLRLLEQAKADLTARRPRAALRRLLRTPLSSPTLRVERERLLLAAACAAKDEDNVQSAIRALGRLGTPARGCEDSK